MDRRKFLKFAGLAGIGLGLSAADLFSISSANAAGAEELSGDMVSSQLAIVIDVGKFRTAEDYKRIIDACHSIHNVPTLIPEKNDPKNEVKWIWTDVYDHTFPEQRNDFHPVVFKEQLFPLLCNHCKYPPCVRVCPTKATFKRKSDGIVIQDPHRCIGCRFCMAACPYGARSFNWVQPRPYIAKRVPDYPTRTIGVVEKCTFCVERLARGLKPNCVDKSNGAMTFGNLADPESDVRKMLATHYTIRRKPALGTRPNMYYVIGGEEYAG